jgi:HKD family nuclease
MAKELLKDLIYGEQLTSAGCEVEFAVGLTYSLDLEAMLTVTLAFSDLGELDSASKLNPAYLLESVRRSSDKFALFCNKGCINVPNEARTIYSLMEGGIFEVEDKKDSIFSNFHPKLWLVKETDRDGTHYLKLSVMSRNLSFSTSLDICCSIRGRIGKTPSAQGCRKHKPLKDMLEWISKYADTTKTEKVLHLAKQLDYVERFELDTPFQTENTERNEDEGYSFFPFVFKEEAFSQYRNDIKSRLKSADRILVVSPFIDTQTLSWLTEGIRKSKNERKTSMLITRKEFATQEVLDMFDQVWVPNDTMIDNTTAKLRLHAKMYLTHNFSDKGHGSGYNLYLGSANATNNAYQKNSEFLLHLHYKHTTNDRIKELLDDIISDNRFVLLDAANAADTFESVDNSKEIALEMSMKCLKNAHVSPSATDGLYDITLNVSGEYDSTIGVLPLQCHGCSDESSLWQPICSKVKFRQLPTHKLSEFYILRLLNNNGEYIKRVVKVSTTGIPHDRDTSIYQSVVTRKEELLDYIAFMLSDRPTQLLFQHQVQKPNHTAGTYSNGYTMPLYESLLKATISNRKKIEDVMDFVRKMKEDIVPAELKDLLETFSKASKQIAEA